MKSRAEDPNISLRVIEKIKDKCNDYYREIPETSPGTLINGLIYDIRQFKKDCLVATELAQQYILKSLEHTHHISKAETFKNRFELEKIGDENKLLKVEICGLQKEIARMIIEKNDSKEENTSNKVEELERKIQELEGFIAIEDMKHESARSGWEASIRKLEAINKQLIASFNESQAKVTMLEKKVKENFSGFSKFLTRKSCESRESQTINGRMQIANGHSIEVQRAGEFMSQISRLSITESEILDYTGIHFCEIVQQDALNIPSYKERNVELAMFKCFKKNEILIRDQCDSLIIKPMIKAAILQVKQVEGISISPTC